MRPENAAANALAGLLRAEEGVSQTCARLVLEQGLAIPGLSPAAIVEQFVTLDIAEKASSIQYPSIHVYCEKLTNKLREKFRTFSGTAQLVIDIRTSHEHLESVGTELQVYVAAVTDLLHTKRGSWGAGTFYTGGYEVAYSPIKRGGRNYVQSAVVRIEVQISAD